MFASNYTIKAIAAGEVYKTETLTQGTRGRMLGSVEPEIAAAIERFMSSPLVDEVQVWGDGELLKTRRIGEEFVPYFTADEHKELKAIFPFLQLTEKGC